MEGARCLLDACSLSASASFVANMMIECLRSGGKILWCGNGGSASDAQHLAAELVGRFAIDRPPLASICLNTDTSVLTALANDYTYESIFARQVEAIGRQGDVLIGISTSGASQNVVKAFRVARQMGIATIAFTGPKACIAWEQADVYLAAPGSTTAHIQEIHISLGQALCGIVENVMFGESSPNGL
jgi:D-sedoheptulose 7-phosphate isomerase